MTYETIMYNLSKKSGLSISLSRIPFDVVFFANYDNDF